jgi:hypothetical protein
LLREREKGRRREGAGVRQTRSVNEKKKSEKQCRKEFNQTTHLKRYGTSALPSHMNARFS